MELQERGKYTFYIVDKQKKTNYPERRRDYRKPISTATINNYIRNLRVFFNYLERNYIIKKNPMKKIRQLRTNRKPKVYLTDEELRKLLANLDLSYFSEHRDYMMIMLMLDSGIRLGECSTLLVTDLELHCKRINLRAEETRGRRERTVFFSPKTEKSLRRWLQRSKTLIFSGPVSRKKHTKTAAPGGGYILADQGISNSRLTKYRIFSRAVSL